MKKAIFLFDYTGVMARPWLAAGYECWLFDGQHPKGVSREGALVKVGMWFDAGAINSHALYITQLVGHGVEFIASFAECTDLTTTGARWWAEKRLADPEFQDKAVRLADMVRVVAEHCHSKGPIPRWMLENPAISALNTLYRRPDHKFHPYEYGGYLPLDDQHPFYPEVYPPRDGYNKLTGIWCGGGFVMPGRKPVPHIAHNPGWAKCGGKSTRTKNIRSCTPRGFAEAVFRFNGHQEWDELI